jgi:EF-hand domain-containing protein 1
VQVLRFRAYFQEPVADSPAEHWRLRKCEILHYLEDGSTQIEEPREDNSGLHQGTLLRRHRWALPLTAYVRVACSTV